MTSHRTTPAVLLILFVGAAALAASSPQGLPDDLQVLMPADAQMVIIATSLDDLERELRAFAPESEDDLDLKAMFDDPAPGMSAHVDGGRPVAVTVAVSAAMMMGGEPGITWIVPVKDDGFDPSVIPAEAGLVTANAGRYQAISTDPTYDPGKGVPAVAQGMAPGLVSVAVDLAAVFEIARPMVGMAMGMMTMAQQEEGADSPMTAEQAEALTGMIDAVMTSLTRLDLAFDADDDDLTMRGACVTAPGSPLAPGDQPDFGDALALTGLLPDDATLVEAIAVDFDSFADMFMPAMELSLTQDLGQMTDDHEAIDRLMDSYRKALAFSSVPMAASASIRDDAMTFAWALESDELDEMTALWTDMMSFYTGLASGGVAFERLDDATIAGTTVERWSFALDAAALAEHGEEDVDEEELARIQDFMNAIMPGYQICQVGDKALSTTLGADDDLAAMIRAADGRSKPHPAAKRLAAAAGSDCQLLCTGDAAPFMNWIMGAVATFEPDAADELPTFDGELPFDMFKTIRENGYGFQGSVGREGIVAFAEFAEKLEALDDDHEHDHDHGHHHDHD